MILISDPEKISFQNMPNMFFLVKRSGVNKCQSDQSNQGENNRLDKE